MAAMVHVIHLVGSSHVETVSTTGEVWWWRGAVGQSVASSRQHPSSSQTRINSSQKITNSLPISLLPVFSFNWQFLCWAFHPFFWRFHLLAAAKTALFLHLSVSHRASILFYAMQRKNFFLAIYNLWIFFLLIQTDNSKTFVNPNWFRICESK